MINSSIVNTAIGLFVVYFLMSSMASVVSEIIGMFLQRRANNMAQFIVDMFHEQQNPYHPNATDFYASPIFQLKEIGGFMGVVAAFGQKVLRWLHHWKWMPNWIPSGVPVVTGSDQILSISTSNFSQAVFEVLNFATDPDHTQTFEHLRQIVTDSSHNALLQDSPLKAALIVAIQQADGSVEKVATHLERWFDGQMQQLTDLYKRRTRGLLFVIGVILAFTLNVDSIAIFQALQNSPILQNNSQAVAQTILGSGLSPSAAATPEATAQPDAAQLSQQITALSSQFQAYQVQLGQIGLPIGWENENPPLSQLNWFSGAGISKILGLIITSVAIALGAQFWFDLLKTLASRPATTTPM